MRAIRFVAALFSGLPIRSALVSTLLAFAFATATGAIAQSEDPPSRVGRLSVVQGPVFVAPDDPNAEWQPLTLNYPITVDDNVWSGHDARAEIDFGAGHLRLSSETNIHFSQLDDRQFSAYLASGRAILRLQMLDPGETAKFDTANMQVDIMRPGTYRIEADADGLGSTFVVREGEAQLRTADSTVTVLSGQTATINGNGPGAALAVRDGYGSDGFDAWSGDRDRRLEGGGISTQYVSSYVPGVRDLDQYGTWDSIPQYGAVWYPTTVASDWVPYRDGSWTFVNPWGWTWVDNAPWGWAPFHYGRWVHIGPRWAWCPGEFVRHPVYAPALVAWFGGPSGTSWSGTFAGGPTFGWVPLGWGEAYWPHHRFSNDYWRLVNRPYAVDVRRVPSKPLQVSYSNARIPGAVTAVSGAVFTGRQPVGRNHISLPAAALAGAAVTTTPLAVRPIVKPLPIDIRPRGAPMPAGALIGRGPAERREIRPPSAGPVYNGRPGLGAEPSPSARQPFAPSVGGGRPGATEPTPSGRPAYTPSVGGPRQSIVEPAPATARPGAGSPPPSAPMQNPGQVYVPSQRQAPAVNAPQQAPGQTYLPAQSQRTAPATSAPLQVPGQVYVPARPQPQAPQPRAPLPEQAPLQQRPFVREAPPPQAAPQYMPQPAPQYAPAPQPQHFVPPQQHVPAPAPPMQPVPVAPAPMPIPGQAQGHPVPQPAPQPQQIQPPGPVPVPAPR